MRVIWLPQAKSQLRQTASYILKEFGQRVRSEFMQDVQHANMLLSENPNLGSPEPLLADRSIMYRSYVVNRLNKIVYFIKEDHIEVADFWDVRREPKKLSERV
jgi:plasmid stabilization system protein ParE